MENDATQAFAKSKPTWFPNPKLTKITLLDIFGEETEKEGRILGRYTNGFNIKDGGGWSCYQHEGDTPAEFWIVKWKGKRKAVGIPKDRIILF